MPLWYIEEFVSKFLIFLLGFNNTLKNLKSLYQLYAKNLRVFTCVRANVHSEGAWTSKSMLLKIGEISEISGDWVKLDLTTS